MSLLLLDMADVDYAFDPDKNSWLIQERGIGFEQIIALIDAGKLLRVLEHPNQAEHQGQLLYEVDVDGYVYMVPVVATGTTLLLKTIYPSRKATKRLIEENR
jgi:uncharacterized DUF497 family protein